LGAVAHLEVDIRGSEHGSADIAEFRFVEAFVEAALAIGQTASYPSIHLKSLSGLAGYERTYSLNTAGKTRDFEFPQIFPAPDARRLRLFKG